MHISPASQALKGAAQSIPAGTQISLSGSKVLPHSNSSASLTLTQIASVPGHKPGGTSPVGHSFQNTQHPLIRYLF